jgi:predicted phage terminase large subunit-like protein
MTRLEPNGSIILVMTRWHEDDLTGRLLNSKGWDSIVLPALATKRDNLGRQVGGALWRERYNRSKLLKIKETLGSYWFSGLYQQSPSPAEGGLFKRLHFRYMEVADGIATSKDFTLSLANLDIYFACDLAVSTKATADYTVVVVFATDSDKNLLLLEVFREKIIPSHHVEVITNLYGRYKPILIGIETVQYQASLFHQLNSVGLPVTKLIPSKDKVTRALPLAAKFESGKIYFSKKMKNLEVIENELLNFPNGRNDDIVDALAYATAMLSMNSSVQPTGYRKSRPNLLKGF